MPLTVEQIYEEAMKLPWAERAELADRLVEGVSVHIDPDIEREQVEVAEARLDEVLSGNEEAVDGPTAMRRARRLLDR